MTEMGFVLTESGINLTIGDNHASIFDKSLWVQETNHTIYTNKSEYYSTKNELDLSEREELQLEAFKKTIGGMADFLANRVLN